MLPAAVDGGNGLVMRVLFDDDAVVNEMDADGDDRSGQTDDVDADGNIDGFSSFDDAFSTSDFITATTDSLMLLVSPTTGTLAGSTGRLFFELLGCSVSPWDGDDNADLPQAVGEIIERINIAFSFKGSQTSLSRQH